MQVVERAAAHDARERYQTAGENWSTPWSARSGRTRQLSSRHGALDATARADIGPTAGRLGDVGTAVAAAALAVAALALGGSLRPPAAEDPMLIRFLSPCRKTRWSWPRLSPDGRHGRLRDHVEGRDTLWVRELEFHRGTAYPSHVGARNCRSGLMIRARVAFFDEGKLKKVRSRGGKGEPQALADAPHPKGGDWNRRRCTAFCHERRAPACQRRTAPDSRR